jgi:predicted permease
VLAIVLTVIVAVAAGVVSERRADVLAHRARTFVLRLMLWALVPFVAYVNVARAHLTFDATVSIAIAFGALMLAGTLTWLLARRRFALPSPQTGAAIVATIQANTAYFGLPLCAALFTHAQLAQAVVYDALVTLPTFVLVSYGVGARLGHARSGGLRAQLTIGLLRNPVLLAVVAALLVPDGWAPEALVTPSRLAIYALLPLGFFVVGVTLADEAAEGTLRIPPPLTPPVAVATVLRLSFVPLVLLLATLVVDVPAPYFVLGAMPVGVNTVLVGHATGLDLRLTSAAIAWSTTLVLVAVVAVGLARAL